MSLEEIEIHSRQVRLGAQKRPRERLIEEADIALKLAQRGLILADFIDAVAQGYGALEASRSERVSASGLYGTVLVDRVPYRVSLSALGSAGLPPSWCRIELKFQSLVAEMLIAFRLELKMIENWSAARFYNSFPVSSGDLAERAGKIRKESGARIQALQEIISQNH